jgi:PTH1 family peptidyl-tRNA hydrolase
MSADTAAPVTDSGYDRPWLVVGLGNPGPRYAGNRHNAGAMAVDAVAAEHGARFTAHRTRALLAQLRLPPVAGRPGPLLVLAKPSSYMNESGGPVGALLRYFSIEVDRLLVVHDELDLPFGQLRLKRSGGEAGHNGVRALTSALRTRDFCRLRMGIGRPPGRMDSADFVLRDFSGAEREGAALMVAEAADVVRDVALLGWDRAQAEVNTRAHAV